MARWNSYPDRMLSRIGFVTFPVLSATVCLLTVALPAATPPVHVADGAYPDLAVDRLGGVHLVYVRDGRLFHRHRPAGSETWSAEQDTGVRPVNPNRSDPEVVTDSRHRPHVLAGNGYAWLNEGKWASIQPGVVRDTALAIDAHDNVYVCRRGGVDGGFLGLRVRRADAAEFVSLADPDVAGGLPLGRNDHVYGHVSVGPEDQSLHVVYRHGAPAHCAYRVSTDGGKTWTGGGISGDDYEGPSGIVAPDGTVYVVSGNGTVHQRAGGPGDWRNLGRALECGKRDLPVLAGDSVGNLYAAGFGGRLNIRFGNQWTGERRLPAPHGDKLGFVALAAGPRASAYAVWEEGSQVGNDEMAGTSALWFARLDPAASAQQKR